MRFKYRLALALGKSVAEINLIGSRELTDWIAFYSIEPFGHQRDNIHSAMIASLIYNTNRGKRSKVMDTSDFMLRDEWEKREKDTANFLSGMRALAKPKDKNG